MTLQARSTGIQRLGTARRTCSASGTPSTRTCVLRVLTHAYSECSHTWLDRASTTTACFRARSHTCTRTFTYTYTHKQARARTRTHTHTLTLTLTHTHTHALERRYFEPSRAPPAKLAGTLCARLTDHEVGPAYPRDPHCLGMGLVVLFSVRCAGLSAMHLPRHQRCMHPDTCVCVCVRACNLSVWT